MIQLTYWGLQNYDDVPAVRTARKALAKQATTMMMEQYDRHAHICENFSGWSASWKRGIIDEMNGWAVNHARFHSTSSTTQNAAAHLSVDRLFRLLRQRRAVAVHDAGAEQQEHHADHAESNIVEVGDKLAVQDVKLRDALLRIAAARALVV